MTECIKCSYEQVENYCLKLNDDFLKDKFCPDCVLGVSVGGLFPAIHFARLLNSKNLVSIAVKSYSGKERKEIEIVNLPSVDLLKDKKVLLVDDVADSGKTLEFIVKLLKEKYFVKDVKTLAVFVNEKNCKIYPDIYLEKIDKWICFPWDRFEKE